MKNIIVITGASSGFGAPCGTRSRHRRSHCLRLGMRETAGRNAAQVEATRQFAAEKRVDLRTIELDVGSARISRPGHQDYRRERRARLADVVIHNAGHMVFLVRRKPSLPNSSCRFYDTNVGNRHAARQSCRAAATTPNRKRAWCYGLAAPVPRRVARRLIFHPTLRRGGRYGCARCELCRRVESLQGIETSIIVPGAFTSAYESLRPCRCASEQGCVRPSTTTALTRHLGDDIMKGFAATAPAEAGCGRCRQSYRQRGGLAPSVSRPFRVHIDLPHRMVRRSSTRR